MTDESGDVNLCRICRETSGPTQRFRAVERMNGTRDGFDYIKCLICGCLQIEHIPQDLSRYYLSDYYSFAVSNRRIKEWLKLQRNRQHSGAKTRVGALLTAVIGPPMFSRWLAFADTQSPKVLDVGSGSGHLVSDLRRVGIDALGVDPYLADDIRDSENSLIVRSCGLTEIDEKYDLIMFHHSLEHIAEQSETLEVALDLLRPAGTILVRIPLVDSYAWRTFGLDWVQLDAPRHLYLHTRHSMTIVAERAGLNVDAIIDDSTIFQLDASKWYANGKDLRSYRHPSFFAKRLKRRLRKETALVGLLNMTHDGDQALFVLRRRGEARAL